MPALTRSTYRLDGFSGSPGYVNFYMQGAVDTGALDTAVAAQKTFLTSVPGLWPTGVTITCMPTATQFTDTTGALITPVTIATVPTVFTGAGGSTYASPCGVVVVWRTARLVVRRLMVGRSFLIPAASGFYDASGTLSDGLRTTLQTAANTYVTRVTGVSDTRPMVWHRNTKGASDGFSSIVTAATINDRVSILTSRRAR